MDETIEVGLLIKILDQRLRIAHAKSAAAMKSGTLESLMEAARWQARFDQLSEIMKIVIDLSRPFSDPTEEHK